MTSTPIPPTMPGPPARPSPDVQHLKVLSVCYYVAAGLNLIGLCGGLVYTVIGLALMFGDMGGTEDAPVSEETIGGFIIAFGLLMLVLSVVFALLNFYAGRFLAQRRRRTYCMVIAGISCLGIPLGTILGIFTFIVLLRPSVIAMFQYAEHGPTA